MDSHRKVPHSPTAASAIKSALQNQRRRRWAGETMRGVGSSDIVAFVIVMLFPEVEPSINTVRFLLLCFYDSHVADRSQI
jgi:hypothetical protein